MVMPGIAAGATSREKTSTRGSMTWKERKLVRRLRARDEEAFTVLVQTYQHKVFNVVYRIVSDRAEAEDVAQEVFVTIFKNVDQFRGEAKFSTWMFRIATNHARNRVKYLARRSRKKHQDIDDTPDAAIDDSPLTADVARPDEQAAGNELEAIIQRGLASLNDIHRTIIILRDIENLSYAEIAEIVELPEGTVKSRLFRARAALKEFVAEQYADEEGADAQQSHG
jgi:RNA polymerase sigma-70 factor (ECF subfamily)